MFPSHYVQWRIIRLVGMGLVKSMGLYHFKECKSAPSLFTYHGFGFQEICVFDIGVEGQKYNIIFINKVSKPEIVYGL